MSTPSAYGRRQNQREKSLVEERFTGIIAGLRTLSYPDGRGLQADFEINSD
jgi:hypothetical protein